MKYLGIGVAIGVAFVIGAALGFEVVVDAMVAHGVDPFR